MAKRRPTTVHRGHRLYGHGHRLLRALRLSRWFDYRWCEVLLSDHRPVPLSAWDADSLWLGEVGPDQLDWLGGLAKLRTQRAAPGHEFALRFASGQRCFAAGLDRGPGAPSPTDPSRIQCVGYLWVAPGPGHLAGECGYVWRLPPQTAWVFDALFHPLVLGTYPDLVRYATAKLRSQGFQSILGQVEYDNHVSRRVHRMMGGARLGWIATLRAGPLLAHLEHRNQRSWGLRWGKTPVDLRAFVQAAQTHPSAEPQKRSAAR